MLTNKYRLWVAGAIVAVVVGGVIGSWGWSALRVRRAEQAVAAARIASQQSDEAARRHERDAAAHLEKTKYLENKIVEIGELARKQDEQLEKLNAVSRTHRERVDVLRHTRSVAATADELCQKLADLGHPCDQ